MEDLKQSDHVSCFMQNVDRFGSSLFTNLGLDEDVDGHERADEAEGGHGGEDDALHVKSDQRGRRWHGGGEDDVLDV